MSYICGLGPPFPAEDMSLSTRINQGSGGGVPAGDGGPWGWRAGTVYLLSTTHVVQPLAIKKTQQFDHTQLPQVIFIHQIN